MKIGIPKEIKPNENRVALVPSGAAALVSAGHQVVIETGAGAGAGFADELYVAAGAELAPAAAPVWDSADLVVKVKEPIEPEWSLLRPDLTVFTYFHFAANRRLTEAHLASGATCIAYETVQLPHGELPLLTPMSEVAGRLAVQEGAHYLEKLYGGRGVLLGGVPGVAPAKVVILGGGVVGTHAAKMAAGLGAQVTILDLSLDRLRHLADILPPNVQLLYSSRHAILEHIAQADLVIGGVLVTGAAAPKLIRREDLATMQPGAVIVDVAVDQGGCVETTHPTTHADPVYLVDGIVHYAVANMPGGVPRTSTLALTNATLPYVLQLANKGWQTALRDNPALLKGLNVVAGHVTYPGIADAFGMACLPQEQFLQ
ncbi:MULTISPECIES: alanine dehydrogenase [unclassified Methylomonas]|uniref:alanine dehydrogenase n=1 Tax=unclassified Methylomonas TaxID=2608980 RepID=UPI0008DA3389|nr:MULTISPECIES: alanine dehydrogenase [unclassified Methylomonas]MDT4329292.1 alanine dehydrogenase [Methylomonas sp. MV1]OHX35876.1 alanine dehydrogenase [Methylomonas sp. LWB]